MINLLLFFETSSETKKMAQMAFQSLTPLASLSAGVGAWMGGYCDGGWGVTSPCDRAGLDFTAQILSHMSQQDFFGGPLPIPFHF